MCKSIILLPVLYGCEIWYFILKEKRNRYSKAKYLKKYLGSYRCRIEYSVTMEFGIYTGLVSLLDLAKERLIWRKLHSEELHDVYLSPSIIKITK
jgi:hypothetical protein